LFVELAVCEQEDAGFEPIFIGGDHGEFEYLGGGKQETIRSQTMVSMENSIRKTARSAGLFRSEKSTGAAVRAYLGGRKFYIYRSLPLPLRA
jgi:hypothetical protein